MVLYICFGVLVVLCLVMNHDWHDKCSAVSEGWFKMTSKNFQKMWHKIDMLEKRIRDLENEKNEDRCVMCGAYVPEGRHVCQECERKVNCDENI